MHSHRIGIADGLERVGPHFDRSDLVIVRRPGPRRRWWRSPLADLDRAGVKRLGGVAVTWGRRAEVIAAIEGLPDPVVIAVSRDPAPKDLPERVEWVRVKAGSTKTCTRVEVDCHPGSAEVRVYDLMEA